MHHKQASIPKESFFTKDKAFYSTLFGMLIVVAFQNLIAYSVNMVDNIMLGSYSQDALSGVTVVNQIFFIIQQVTLGIANSLVILASQYWGQKRVDPIRSLTGIALKFGLICSLIILTVCLLLPRPLLSIFTSDETILSEGLGYLSIVVWSFILFIFTNILMAALRSVGTVKISFYISIVSLILNVIFNTIFIYGYLGFPELGARGAALSTLLARLVEFAIIFFYALKIDKKLSLFSGHIFRKNSSLRKDYTKVATPMMISQILWSISVPFQTAILGHLSTDAIAANSVATTFYQYLKVVVVAMSSTSSVMIGNAIGRGDMHRVRSDARTLAVIDVLIGLVLACLLFLLRRPLLSFYNLSDTATELAIHLIAVMSIVMIGMSYQMPVSGGIIGGGGDTKFTMYLNIISVWLIVIPLSIMAAFVWDWPVELVVLCVQSDQIFKGIPVFIRFRSYKWIKKLTKEQPEQSEPIKQPEHHP